MKNDTLKNLENDKKLTRYSYSKLSTYEDCPYKFKLIYLDKHYIDSSSISFSFGTLVHYIEELIARDLKNNIAIDYEKYIDMFINLNLSEEDKKVYGVKELKRLFPNEFYKEDKSGMKYSEKCALYVNESIYRLESFLKQNPDLEILDAEKEFNLIYKDYLFYGFIDRLFRNKVTGEILIEDIKTYSQELGKDKLTTPLQFVFYSLAVQDMYKISEDKISCSYDLPLCCTKQIAGTKGFIKRGLKKINLLLENINSNNFKPNPKALCYWCPFCANNPNQVNEAKNLCPYYSEWTPENKNFNVHYEWMGEEEHKAILEAFRADNDASKVFGLDLLNSSNYASNTCQIKRDSDKTRFFKIHI